MNRDGSRHSTFTQGPLEAAVAAVVLDVAQRTLRVQVADLVREELARQGAHGPGGPEWLSQPAAASIAGVSPQTIRSWLTAGHLAKGRRGRVNAGELRRFLEGNAPSPVASVANLGAQRAKATAAAILAKGAK